MLPEQCCGTVIINTGNMKMQRLIFYWTFGGIIFPSNENLCPKGSTLPVFIPSQGMMCSKEIITLKVTKDEMCYMKNEEGAETYNSRL